MTGTSNDSRGSSRVRLTILADVTLRGLVQRLQVTNLSLGGVAVATTDPIPVGTECQVTLLLDGGDAAEHCRLEGRVVRSSDADVGIVFTAVVGLDGLEHLHNLILYNAPEPDRVAGEFAQHLGLRRRD